MTGPADFLTAAGVRIVTAGHPHVSAGWIGLDCPFCGPGTGRFHAGINLAGLYVYCWKCGPHRLVDTLALATRKSPREIAAVGFTKQRGTVADRPAGRYREPPGVGELLPIHRRYLEGRGFNPDEIAERWRVRGIGPDGGPLAWRLFIPIIFDGRPVSWTARAVGDSAARYRNAADGDSMFSPKSLLYGEDLVPGTAAVCVEGPLDVWAIGPGAVGLLGIGVTAAQTRRLARYARLAVAFDAERPAQRRAERLAASVAVLGPLVTVIELETGSDPAEADRVELDQIRKEFL